MAGWGKHDSSTFYGLSLHLDLPLVLPGFLCTRLGILVESPIPRRHVSCTLACGKNVAQQPLASAAGPATTAAQERNVAPPGSLGAWEGREGRAGVGLFQSLF